MGVTNCYIAYPLGVESVLNTVCRDFARKGYRGCA